MGRPRSTSHRPRLEVLEDRLLLAAGATAAAPSRVAHAQPYAPVAPAESYSSDEAYPPDRTSGQSSRPSAPGSATTPSPTREAAEYDRAEGHRPEGYREEGVAESAEHGLAEGPAILRALLPPPSPAAPQAPAPAPREQPGTARLPPPMDLPSGSGQAPGVLPRHTPVAAEVRVALAENPPATAEPAGARQLPDAPAEEGGAEQAVALAPEPGVPLAGLVPVDLKALREGIDSFFARLAELTEGPDGSPLLDLAPWLVVAGAVVGELILLPRVLRRRQPEVDPTLPGPPFSPAGEGA